MGAFARIAPAIGCQAILSDGSASMPFFWVILLIAAVALYVSSISLASILDADNPLGNWVGLASVVSLVIAWLCMGLLGWIE